MRKWLLFRITSLKSASAGCGKVCVLSSGRISFSLTGSRAPTHALRMRHSLGGICKSVYKIRVDNKKSNDIINPGSS